MVTKPTSWCVGPLSESVKPLSVNAMLMLTNLIGGGIVYQRIDTGAEVFYTTELILETGLFFTVINLHMCALCLYVL